MAFRLLQPFPFMDALAAFGRELKRRPVCSSTGSSFPFVQEDEVVGFWLPAVFFVSFRIARKK
jgi:hypothetical protein